MRVQVGHAGDQGPGEPFGTRTETKNVNSLRSVERAVRYEITRQFAGYLQHDNKEETLRQYGETVIPALKDHVTAKA